jgi:hypothetical protein
MAGPSLTTDAFILSKRPPADHFQTLTAFSAAEGTLLTLQRLPKKSASVIVPLDLFDEASLVLESSNQGQTWFIKETRLLNRPVDIARSYDALRLASSLASLIARNAVPEESRGRVYALLRQSFDAFGASDRPDIVYLKSVYLFSRDEGYPLKQEWFPTLPAAEQAILADLLRRPLSAQTAPAPAVARLQRRLEDYLRSRTEILLD